MGKISIAKTKKFNIEINDIPPDKSISHRCAIFSLLCNKPSCIQNYLLAKDTICTLNIAKQLGLNVKHINKNTMLFIPPLTGLKEPENILNCGNSATTMRLYTGLLSTHKGYFVLTGDKSLKNRPMARVIEPLNKAGGKIYARKNNSLAPISILGSNIKNFIYKSPIASAQVKSAMILAGIRAQENSVYFEPSISRNHTENMLQAMGANIAQTKGKIKITPTTAYLSPLNINIPADPSSAFFFALAAAIIPQSKALLKNILLNPTRIAGFEILRQMGTKVEYEITQEECEKIGNIYVEQKPLQAINIQEDIPMLLDELPALSIAMAIAKGKSVVRNAKELRFKKSDRINSIVSNLTKMGITCEEYEDGYAIYGGELQSCIINSFNDHRVAMSFAIAGLICGVEIQSTSCVDISFPNFLKILGKITTIQNQY